MPVAKRLNQRQKLFVREYLADSNGSRAAIAAGYSPNSARDIASELLRKPHVAEAIAKEQARLVTAADIRAEDVILGLKRIAFADIGDLVDKHGDPLPLNKLPPDLAKTIASFEVESLGGNRITQKVKLPDRLKALELLGKRLGLFVDKVQHEAGPSLEELVLKSMKAKQEPAEPPLPGGEA